MFYGLSKLIKRILPKQLFYRGLLIVATPIIILQVTISLVFFDSLWIKTNKGMTKALVSEVRTFIDAYDNDQNNKDYIIVMFKDYLQFNIKYEENKKIPKIKKERWFSPIDRSLRRELKSQNLTFFFDTSSYVNLIDLTKERSIDVIITRLRKKIEENPKSPKYLQTIRGEGYVLWIE